MTEGGDVQLQQFFFWRTTCVCICSLSWLALTVVDKTCMLHFYR